MERLRSSAMADTIFSKKLALPRQDDERSWRSVRPAGGNRSVAEEAFLIIAGALIGKASLQESRQAEQQIAELEKADREAAARLTKKAPRLRELIVSQPASLERVREMLRRDGSEMLYYLSLDDSVILWHIAGEDQHVRSVLFPRSELKAKVAALRASVSSPDAKFDEKSARELFLYLIQPALSWIKSRQLVLIPHAEMHRLPFAALVAP